jgi:hypothetical protein
VQGLSRIETAETSRVASVDAFGHASPPQYLESRENPRPEPGDGESSEASSSLILSPTSEKVSLSQHNQTTLGATPSIIHNQPISISRPGASPSVIHPRAPSPSASLAHHSLATSPRPELVLSTSVTTSVSPAAVLVEEHCGVDIGEIVHKIDGERDGDGEKAGEWERAGASETRVMRSAAASAVESCRGGSVEIDGLPAQATVAAPKASPGEDPGAATPSPVSRFPHPATASSQGKSYHVTRVCAALPRAKPTWCWRLDLPQARVHELDVDRLQQTADHVRSAALTPAYRAQPRARFQLGQSSTCRATAAPF